MWEETHSEPGKEYGRGLMRRAWSLIGEQLYSREHARGGYRVMGELGRGKGVRAMGESVRERRENQGNGDIRVRMGIQGSGGVRAKRGSQGNVGESG